MVSFPAKQLSSVSFEVSKFYLQFPFLYTLLKIKKKKSATNFISIGQTAKTLGPVVSARFRLVLKPQGVVRSDKG